MESTAFFERKIALSPRDLNTVGMGEKSSIDDILLKKLKQKVEEKCSEHGFVLPGVKILSRSMGAFEAARFTGDAIYFVKAEGKVLYPADGMRVQGQVIRKNKMGLYVNYRDALRIQVPRDLHLGNDSFEEVAVGDTVEVQLKKSIFQINDPYILTNGLFLQKVSGAVAALSTAATAPATVSPGPAAAEPMTGPLSAEAIAAAKAMAAVEGAGAGAGLGATATAKGVMAQIGEEEEEKKEEEEEEEGEELPVVIGATTMMEETKAEEESEEEDE